MYVKAEIAENDTDLSCIKPDINVLKGCAFVKHFETLIHVNSLCLYMLSKDILITLTFMAVHWCSIPQ